MKRRSVRNKHSISASNVVEFETLFKSHYLSLLDYAHSLVHSESIAEDVVQEVFIKIWSLKATQKATRSYLYSAIRRRSLNALEADQSRKLGLVRKQQESNVEVFGHSAEEEFTASELATKVDQILADMPQRRREIFILSRYHGFSRSEVAQLLGISEKTAKKQMEKALSSFRLRLRGGTFLISLLMSLFLLF